MTNFLRRQGTRQLLFAVVLSVAVSSCSDHTYQCAIQAANGNTLANRAYKEKSLQLAEEKCESEGRDLFPNQFGSCLCGGSGGSRSPTAPGNATSR